MACRTVVPGIWLIAGLARGVTWRALALTVLIFVVKGESRMAGHALGGSCPIGEAAGLTASVTWNTVPVDHGVAWETFDALVGLRVYADEARRVTGVFFV